MNATIQIVTTADSSDPIDVMLRCVINDGDRVESFAKTITYSDDVPSVIGREVGAVIQKFFNPQGSL